MNGKGSQVYNSHIFPHAARTNSGKMVYKDQETVNCCIDCNSLISDLEPYNIVRRIELLIAKTEYKFQLQKHIPEWGDDELNELGFSLRSAVKGKIKQRQRALDRVMHMRGVWRKIILDTDV
mgnify:CR=1 FL=1